MLAKGEAEEGMRQFSPETAICGSIGLCRRCEGYEIVMAVLHDNYTAKRILSYLESAMVRSAEKDSILRLAPPTSAPETSSEAIIGPKFSGVTLPP